MGCPRSGPDQDKAIEESKIIRERVVQLRAAAAKGGGRARTKSDLARAQPYAGRKYPRRVAVPEGHGQNMSCDGW